MTGEIYIEQYLITLINCRVGDVTAPKNGQ